MGQYILLEFLKEHSDRKYTTKELSEGIGDRNFRTTSVKIRKMVKCGLIRKELVYMGDKRNRYLYSYNGDQGCA